MARNPVQFQKGISLNEFLSLYGTEQQCFDALYRWRWPNGFVCPNCGHDRGCQLTTHKLQQCYRCNRQTSITAGTIFEATKLPLTVWFQGIYFMTQDKKGASAMKLHRQLGISYNAAWRMRHKLMQVMMERDREHLLGGFIQLDDAYLGGERSGGKHRVKLFLNGQLGSEQDTVNDAALGTLDLSLLAINNITPFSHRRHLHPALRHPEP